jgi:hypothetical protein
MAITPRGSMFGNGLGGSEPSSRTMISSMTWYLRFDSLLDGARRTMSPIWQSSCSSCAKYLVRRGTSRMYLGCL